MLLPIENSPGVFAQVDDDMEHLCMYSWKQKVQHDGYRYVYTCCKTSIREEGNTILSRLVLLAPPGSIVDHINGDTLDNRSENLRFCTPSQSSVNTKTKSNNRSGLKGVAFELCGDGLRRWRACVTWQGVKHKKYFLSAELASKWAVQKRAELHGDFVRHM